MPVPSKLAKRSGVCRSIEMMDKGQQRQDQPTRIQDRPVAVITPAVLQGRTRRRQGEGESPMRSASSWLLMRPSVAALRGIRSMANDRSPSIDVFMSLINLEPSTSMNAI